MKINHAETTTTRKQYRVIALTLNKQNRSKSFRYFEDAKDYIEKCFAIGCNLVHMIRPDDTSALYLSADMRIIDQPRMGSYSVFELAATSNAAHIERITAHGLDTESDAGQQHHIDFSTLSIAHG